MSINFNPVSSIRFSATKKCDKPCNQDTDCKAPEKAEKQDKKLSLAERLALAAIMIQNLNPPINPSTDAYVPQMVVPPMVDPGNPGGIWM